MLKNKSWTVSTSCARWTALARDRCFCRVDGLNYCWCNIRGSGAQLSVCFFCVVWYFRRWVDFFFQGNNKIKHMALASQSQDWDTDRGPGDWRAGPECHLIAPVKSLRTQSVFVGLCSITSLFHLQLIKMPRLDEVQTSGAQSSAVQWVL